MYTIGATNEDERDGIRWGFECVRTKPLFGVCDKHWHRHGRCSSLARVVAGIVDGACNERDVTLHVAIHKRSGDHQHKQKPGACVAGGSDERRTNEMNSERRDAWGNAHATTSRAQPLTTKPEAQE